MNQVLNENERLLEQVISKDIVNTIVNSSVDIAFVNVHECKKYLKLETELLNKKDFVEKEIYDKLFKSFTTLEKYCISLEVDSQLNHEIFQRNNFVSNQSAPSFDQLSAHSDYLKHTQEEAMILREIVEQGKSQNPLNTSLDSACIPSVLKSVSANKKEPSQSWGSIVSDVPSSSLDECRSSKLFSGMLRYQGLLRRRELGHNLFFVGQFCDSNLEVAFRQHTCFIRNLEGVDLLTGSRGNNLYTLSLGDMMASSPICLLSKASKTNKKKLYKPKSEDTNQEKLYLLHMDLCGLCVSQVVTSPDWAWMEYVSEGGDDGGDGGVTVVTVVSAVVGWPELAGGGAGKVKEGDEVSDKTEKLSGMSFYIKWL
ncbi:hypothetical protein Tco_0755767 [Tanacetum coccineum]